MGVPFAVMAVRSVVRLFENVPVAFHPVRMHVAVYVLTGVVIDNTMLELLIKVLVGLPGIGIDVRALFDVRLYRARQRLFCTIFYYSSPHFTVTLSQSHYDGFGETLRPHFPSAVGVHVLGLA